MEIESPVERGRADLNVVLTIAATGAGAMTVAERNERLLEIENLKKSLEEWLVTPMPEYSRELGTAAIEARLAALSRSLEYAGQNRSA